MDSTEVAFNYLVALPLVIVFLSIFATVNNPSHLLDVSIYSGA